MWSRKEPRSLLASASEPGESCGAALTSVKAGSGRLNDVLSTRRGEKIEKKAIVLCQYTRIRESGRLSGCGDEKNTKMPFVFMCVPPVQ